MHSRGIINQRVIKLKSRTKEQIRAVFQGSFTIRKPLIRIKLLQRFFCLLFECFLLTLQILCHSKRLPAENPLTYIQDSGHMHRSYGIFGRHRMTL